MKPAFVITISPALGIQGLQFLNPRETSQPAHPTATPPVAHVAALLIHSALHLRIEIIMSVTASSKNLLLWLEPIALGPGRITPTVPRGAGIGAFVAGDAEGYVRWLENSWKRDKFFLEITKVYVDLDT